MRTTPLFRLTGALAVAVFIGLRLGAAELPAEPAAGAASQFQPLHRPATGEQHPGKFVWADLFTSDPVAATKFYSGVFGWSAAIIDQSGKTYTVFSNDGHPVAGLASRNTANKKRPSRWITYLAVTEIKSTLAQAVHAGAQERAPAREFPQRGTQAIILDPEGSPIGLLQSSSGDAADDEPKPGDWNWFELYAKEPKAASDFYAQAFNYTVTPDDRTERKNDYLLTSDNVTRGGVAPLPDRENSQPGWLGVVRVANIDDTLSKVTALGGEIVVAPRTVAYESRFAIIADPTGGTVGVVEYVDNANPATRP